MQVSINKSKEEVAGNTLYATLESIITKLEEPITKKEFEIAEKLVMMYGMKLTWKDYLLKKTISFIQEEEWGSLLLREFLG